SLAPDQPQVLLDLREREAEALRLLDRADEAHGLRVVGAVPARAAHRLGQEAPALVVAQRLDVDAGPLRHLADPHVGTIDPYLGTDVKRLRVELDVERAVGLALERQRPLRSCAR